MNISVHANLICLSQHHCDYLVTHITLTSSKPTHPALIKLVLKLQLPIECTASQKGVFYYAAELTQRRAPSDSHTLPDMDTIYV